MEPLLFPIELKAEVSPSGRRKIQIPKNLPLGPHGVTKSLIQTPDVCVCVCVWWGVGCEYMFVFVCFRCTVACACVGPLWS